jgi:hypothetical protein
VCVAARRSTAFLLTCTLFTQLRSRGMPAFRECIEKKSCVQSSGGQLGCHCCCFCEFPLSQAPLCGPQHRSQTRSSALSSRLVASVAGQLFFLACTFSLGFSRFQCALASRSCCKAQSSFVHGSCFSFLHDPPLFSNGKRKRDFCRSKSRFAVFFATCSRCEAQIWCHIMSCYCQGMRLPASLLGGGF